MKELNFVLGILVLLFGVYYVAVMRPKVEAWQRFFERIDCHIITIVKNQTDCFSCNMDDKEVYCGQYDDKIKEVLLITK